MEAQIKDAYPGTEVELIRSGGGVFEVAKDGETVFSKKRTGRHPTWDEIREKLD